MTAPVAIGTAAYPTPVGQYFVAFFELPPSPGYGPFIVVPSAHYPTIGDWEHFGDAVIGIHGPIDAGAVIGRPARPSRSRSDAACSQAINYRK
jgi:hypothetical protein